MTVDRRGTRAPGRDGGRRLRGPCAHQPQNGQRRGCDAGWRQVIRDGAAVADPGQRRRSVSSPCRLADTGTGSHRSCARGSSSRSSPPKPAGAGTGLGLALVEATVREAGGRLEVDSVPGRGRPSRFCCPRRERAGRDGARRTPVVGAVGRGGLWGGEPFATGLWARRAAGAGRSRAVFGFRGRRCTGGRPERILTICCDRRRGARSATWWRFDVGRPFGYRVRQGRRARRLGGGIRANRRLVWPTWCCRTQQVAIGCCVLARRGGAAESSSCRESSRRSRSPDGMARGSRYSRKPFDEAMLPNRRTENLGGGSGDDDAGRPAQA